ncbi:CU044_5270 family protein [Nonomuraea sp. NPDC049480]|uniref:CU044_5270 family protein n=1 Tax=Nonomuraea sp. NPDC049480 TaxID=3364353 RepID=UPI0037990656
MDELKLLEEFCRDVTPTRRTAVHEGRARLLSEINEPRRARAPRFSPPLVGAVAVVGALTAAVAIGITIAQNVDGPPADHPNDASTSHPSDMRANRPGGAVVNVQEVALHAKAAARNQPAVTLTPGEWVYVKTLMVEIDGRVLGPGSKRTSYEEWRTVDGKVPPRNDNVFVPTRQPTAKVLIDLPEDPDAALAALYAEVERIKERGTGQAEDGPVLIGNGIIDTPRGIAAFNLVSEILKSYHVPPQLQATLYGALARMPGVKMLPDSVDAQGRHGLALYVISEGYIRQEIILDRDTYRYLGNRRISISDHTVPPPGKNVETDSHTSVHIKKGDVLGWSAQLGSALVDKPGERP